MSDAARTDRKWSRGEMAARLDPSRNWGDAGLAQVRWAIGRQRPNGWMADCCLEEPHQPLTHTLGYSLRGILEAWRFSRDRAFLEAGTRLAEGLLGCLDRRKAGWLPGRLNAEWKPAVDWVCLTGSVQIAHCWLMLYQDTGDAKWLDAARSVNGFVRRTVAVGGPAERRGAVQGSFPVDGDYGTHQNVSVVGRLLVTKAEASVQLGISVRTVERLIAAGRLPLVHVEGAARLRVADLEAYVDALVPPDTEESERGNKV